MTRISAAGKVREEAIQSGEGSGCNSLEKVNNAVATINKRSQSLLNFVQSYRQLTRIPKPEFQNIKISELLQRIQQFMQPQLEASGTRLEWSEEFAEMKLTCDPSQIEQVLINLIQNALQSINEMDDGLIRVSATGVLNR